MGVGVRRGPRQPPRPARCIAFVSARPHGSARPTRYLLPIILLTCMLASPSVGGGGDPGGREPAAVGGAMGAGAAGLSPLSVASPSGAGFLLMNASRVAILATDADAAEV